MAGLNEGEIVALRDMFMIKGPCSDVDKTEHSMGCTAGGPHDPACAISRSALADGFIEALQPFFEVIERRATLRAVQLASTSTPENSPTREAAQ